MPGNELFNSLIAALMLFLKVDGRFFNEFIEFMHFDASMYGDLLRMTTFDIYTSSDIFEDIERRYHKK